MAYPIFEPLSSAREARLLGSFRDLLAIFGVYLL
jgi:hypothetical protein